MSSKQLSSILNKVPPATANNTVNTSYMLPQQPSSFQQKSFKEPTERIVAVVPIVVKEQLKNYIKNHPRETERTVILRALKAIGFNIDESWLVDYRSKR